MTSLVNCNGVAKRYMRGNQPVDVLTTVDLQIESSDFIALMGPSGSGKTTLLNLLGGLDRPTRGTLEVSGAMLNTMTSAGLAHWRAANVGFVFQFYNLLPVLSAQHNVELPLLLTHLGAAQRQKNAATALQIVGLADRAKHKPAELSGGQQQRVAIARAIVADPKLLLCDEPTGDLDRATADEILALLQTLNREYGKTIVMVTHDPKAAEYARTVLHMDKGRLVHAAACHDAVRSVVRESVPASHAYYAHAAVADDRVPAVHAAARHCGGVCGRRDGGRHGPVDRRCEVLDERQPAAGNGRAGAHHRRCCRCRADELVRRVLPGPEEQLRAVRHRPLSVFQRLQRIPDCAGRTQTIRIDAHRRGCLDLARAEIRVASGDALSLHGLIWPKQDGSWDWQFQFIGTFDYPKGAPDQPLLLLHYDYFNEAVAMWARDQVGWLAVRVADPKRLDEVGSTIDALYKNSSDPTRTVSQDEYSRAQAAQFGDMGFITTMILSAVFFTIVLLTGNVALQSFRERIPELAVLKTLGFTDSAVGTLVLCEALLLCVTGAALGIALALLLEPAINSKLISIVGRFDMTWQSVLIAIALALAIGLGIGLPPAYAARRLTIVDALRGH